MLTTNVALSHPNHRILGIVTMAASDHVMLKTRDGKDVTIKVTGKTKVTREKKAIKASDIPAGARIVAVTVSDEDLTAKTIEVGVAPAAK